MDRTLPLLIALFSAEISLLLLAGWIYNRLARAGAFGANDRTRRLGAVVFITLPVLCGLALLPAAVLLNGQMSLGGVIDLPGAAPRSPSGKIVYTCQVFGDMERDQICLIYPDGSGQARLTLDDEGDYNFPALAPDGLSVIFSGRTEAGYELFELEIGGVPRQLTLGLEDATAPDISPDGRQVVFARRTAEGQSIWVMDRDGGDPRQAFGPPAANGWDPVWSPDGRQILFASDRAGGIQLFRMDGDGANLAQVSQMDKIRGRSDWSPDGQTVTTYAGDSWNREIYRMDLDGTSLQQLTSGGNNLAPSFSPEGDWITFTSYRDRYRDENGCEIYIMRLDGSQVTRLTDNTTCDWQPRWGN